MNEEDPSGHNISLGSFRNQHQQGFDSFEVSADTTGKKSGMNLLGKNSKDIPQLQAFENEINSMGAGIMSPANSNIPTQGDIKSPKEEDYRPSNFGMFFQGQLPNQAQDRRDIRNRSHRSHEGTGEIFSFRRDQGHGLNFGNRGDREPGNLLENIRSQSDEINPLSGRDSYDKTRILFTKLKKYYVYGLLNVACICLVVFNLMIAYNTAPITFPKIEQIDAQFRQKVVLDIDLTTKAQNCSELYTPSKMGNWPGTDNICECPSQTFSRSCGEAELKEGCQNLGSFRPTPIQYWDGKRICLRKSEKSLLGYYETSGFLESYSGNLLCPNGMKKCVISSTKNFICVGKFEFCPVNQIEIEDGKDQDKNKFKAQLSLDTKIMVYDNQGSADTTFMDILVEPEECSNQGNSDNCTNDSQNKLIDTEDEYKLLRDNSNTPEAYEIFKKSNNSMGLYIVPMNYLDMCVFNNTFNPVVINSQLSNWKAVKYILFINPYFITTLLVVNLLRVFTINYMNVNTVDRIPQKRKKEIYSMFGRSFVGSSIVVITEVLTILYYIFWGYLLLNPDRLIAEKWLAMNCIPDEIKVEIQHMISEFTRIETFNMMTIGPMILGCIMEALFSQYRLITSQSYTHIHSES